MATSPFLTSQYTSENFVDSAGAVLFHLSSHRICLIHLIERKEWLLAKGRRNCTESRAATALREVTEETGLPARLLDVRISTRAPPIIEEPDGSIDTVRVYEGAVEPFMLTLRKTSEQNVKLIWWYIAAVDEDRVAGVSEEKYSVGFFGYSEAIEMLTYKEDREVVQRAVDIVLESRDSR